MKTTVGLRGVEFYAFHGYYEEERKAGNTFIVDLEVELKTFDSSDDNINDTVNYEKLYSICEEEMKNTQKLLETVVLNILTNIKNRYEKVISAKVKLEKLAPQLGGKVEKAVVTMTF